MPGIVREDFVAVPNGYRMGQYNMKPMIIYHNGECSKCRGALELIQEIEVPHEVRWYLTDPLSREELLALLKKLARPVSEIIRKEEPLVRELVGQQTPSEDEWLEFLLKHPGLMQRPIVELGDKAIIARPPETVLSFIKEHT